MGPSVSLIFLWCFPEKMMRTDASKVSVAARMSRLMYWTWWRAVSCLADKPLSQNSNPSHGDMPCIAILVSRVWPDQAIFAGVVKRNAINKDDPLPRSCGCSHQERVTIREQTIMMLFTKPTSYRDFVATIDTTKFSHPNEGRVSVPSLPSVVLHTQTSMSCQCGAVRNGAIHSWRIQEPQRKSNLLGWFCQ